MLTAILLKSKGFRADHIYEVSASGSPIATLNETRFTFAYNGSDYSILHKGVFTREYQLKCADADVITANGAAFRNIYTMVLDGKQWVLKARGISAQKFGLFLNDIELGSVSDGGKKGVVADLPDELPIHIQLFLLAILIWKWSASD
jgi:hypothetical protein